MIAQFAPWKGHRRFIEAAHLVLERNPGVVFVIAGEDLFGDNVDYREELLEFCKRLGVQDKVIFTGFVDDTTSLVADLDLLVLPSRREPFGRVIVEAMAMEKAVVCTNEGGPAEIVQHGATGLLVPPDDPGALSEAMLLLLGDGERRTSMGRAGRERVETYFDIAKTVRDIEAVYQEVARAG